MAADKVLELMSDRGQTLRGACRELGLLPSTFLAWVGRDEDGLRERYARAKDALLDYWSDEIVDVADECLAISDNVQQARLRVDARKWLLSKLRPEQYGDSSKQTIDMTLKGEDPATVLAARRKAREGE
jgi:hypothetical protein